MSFARTLREIATARQLYLSSQLRQDRASQGRCLNKWMDCVGPTSPGRSLAKACAPATPFAGAHFCAQGELLSEVSY